jgi:hypothetical protein
LNRKRNLDYRTIPKNIYVNFIVREIKDILEDGEKLLKGEFKVFSYKIKVNKFPQWNIDYITGNKVPAQFFRRIKRESGGAEIRSIWELNRLQFLPLLGLCYTYTGNNKYYILFKDILSDWDKNNPFLNGVNWMNAMECSIRASNIIMAFSIFEKELKNDPKYEEVILDIIYRHGLYIEFHLEKGISNLYGNHYLSDIFGLLIISTFLYNNKRAIKWKKFATREIVKASDKCIHQGGIAHEHSIGYHKYITELYFYVLLFFHEDLCDNKHQIQKNLFKMIQFLFNIEQPNGKLPTIGDCDDGKIFSIDNYFNYDPLDLYLLKKTVVVEHEFYNLLFSVNLQQYDKQCNFAQLYEQPGVLLYKYGVTAFTFLFWNVGSGGQGAHQHNDILSFTLFISDTPVVVDPGTYCYLSNNKYRNFYRSTKAHNTITVDGYELNTIDPKQVFGMKENTKVDLLEYFFDVDLISCSVENNAYQRLDDPVMHKRTVELRNNKTFTIIDDFYSLEVHEIIFNIHFHPSLKVEICGEMEIFLSNGSNNFKIKTNFDELEIKTYSYSESFLSKKKAKKAILKSKIFKSKRLSTEIITL